MAGAYSDYVPLDDETKAIFAQFQAEINAQANGLELVAEKVSTQVVNGLNYRFLAVAGDKKFNVVIWRHSNGDIKVTDVNEVTA